METLEHIKERGLILIVPTFIAFYSPPSPSLTYFLIYNGWRTLTILEIKNRYAKDNAARNLRFASPNPLLTACMKYAMYIF